MKRFSKLDSKQRTIAVSGFSALALVSLVGGIYAINASADGDIIINFSSAASVTQGDAGAYNIAYTIGQDDVLVTFGNFVDISTSNKTLTINPNDRHDIDFEYRGNFSENYVARLRESGNTTNPFETDLSCTYTSHDENPNTFEEGISHCVIPSELNLPSSSDLIIEAATNNPPVQSGAYVIRMPNAHASDLVNPSNDAVWEFNETESVTMSIQTNDNNPTVTPSNGMQASFSGGAADAKASFSGTINDDVCDTYNFTFSDPNSNFPDTPASCTYDSNTSKSVISVPTNINLPGDSIDFDITKKQSQPVANPFTVFYDSVTTGSTETKVNFDVDGTTVGVTLTGMTYDSNTNKSVSSRDALLGANPTAYFTVDNNFNADTMQFAVSGSEQYHQVLAVNNNVITLTGLNVAEDSIHFGIEVIGNGDEPGPDHPDHPGQPTVAKVTVTSSDDAHSGSYAYAGIFLNERGIDMNCDVDHDTACAPARTINAFEYNYDEENDNNEVTFQFGTRFDRKFVGTITIVGENSQILKTINIANEIVYEDKLSCLKHTHGQELSFRTQVPKSSEYGIIVDTEQNPEENTCIANFLWTSNEEAKNSDEYIGHSHLDLLSVEWTPIGGGEKIIINKEDFNEPLTEAQQNAGMVLEFDPGDDHHPGSLVVSADAVVTMGIVPEYGYQVRSFGVNAAIVTTGEAISEFTFPVGVGNFHLGAEVEKTSDLVATNTEKVTGGTIELGGAEIATGTALLTVSDADIDDEQVNKFKDAAEGYNVSTYLDKSEAKRA